MIVKPVAEIQLHQISSTEDTEIQRTLCCGNLDRLWCALRPRPHPERLSKAGINRLLAACATADLGPMAFHLAVT